MAAPAAPTGDPGPLFRRARIALGVCTVAWAATLGLLLDGAVLPPDLPPEVRDGMLLSHGICTAITAISVPSARAGSLTGWGIAVVSAALQLLTCLLAPLGLYALYLLSRKPALSSAFQRSSANA
jgi:hypothetical protein